MKNLFVNHLPNFSPLAFSKAPLLFFFFVVLSFFCSLRPWNISLSLLYSLGSFTLEQHVEWRKNNSEPASKNFSSPSDLYSVWTAGAQKLSSLHRLEIAYISILL